MKTFQLVARGDGDCKTRYRPQRISEAVPTFPVKEVQSILTSPNASRVWLFGGLTGAGKTTVARILARALACTCEDPAVEKPCLECRNCKTLEHSPDYVEINAAKFGGKDETKQMTFEMGYRGHDLGGKKFYVYDEVHGLTPAAQELLLKELEEPPENAYFFLCTTHVKGLKRTFLGRCSQIKFARLSLRQATTVVQQVCADSNVTPPVDSVIETLFHQADGSVRDLLNLMDKVLLGTYEDGMGIEAEGEEGAPNIFLFADALKERDWKTVRDILLTENVQNSPDGYRQVVCDTLRRKALKTDQPSKLIANALDQLTGSLADEPRNEAYNIFVLRCMKLCGKL